MYTGHSVQWSAQKVSRVSVDESRPQNYQITAAVIKELWWTCSVMKYDSAAVVWFRDQSIIIISAKGATGDWSNSTPTDGKMGKGKILAIAGLGIRLAGC